MARPRHSWDLRGTTDVFLLRIYVSLPNDSARAQVYNAVNPSQLDISETTFWNHYSNRFRPGSNNGGISPDWIEVCNLDGHLTQQEMINREQTQWRPRIDEMVRAAHELGYIFAEYIQGGIYDPLLHAQLNSLWNDAALRARVLQRSRHLSTHGLAASNIPAVPVPEKQAGSVPPRALHQPSTTPADLQEAVDVQARPSPGQQDGVAQANTMSPRQQFTTGSMNGVSFHQAEQTRVEQHDLPFSVSQQDFQETSNPGNPDPQSRRLQEQQPSVLEPVHARTTTNLDQQSSQSSMATQTQDFASFHQQALLARKYELLRELEWIDAELADSTDMHGTLAESQPATTMDQVSLEQTSASREAGNMGAN